MGTKRTKLVNALTATGELQRKLAYQNCAFRVNAIESIGSDEFVALVKDRMKFAGITMKAVSEALGHHQSTMSRKINGLSELNNCDRLALIALLGIDDATLAETAGDKLDAAVTASFEERAADNRGRKPSVKVAIRRARVKHLIDRGATRAEIAGILGLDGKLPTLNSDMHLVRAEDYDDGWLAGNALIEQEIAEAYEKDAEALKQARKA
jgi:hypothetical protein